MALSSSSIPENSRAGAVVGSLSTADFDLEDVHTYALLDDAGGRFQLVGSTIQVANSSLLDFETASSHTIKVQSTDLAGAAITRLLTIAITNVNEAPLATNLTTTLNEDEPTAVTLIATDPEHDPLTYTIVDSPLHGVLTGHAPYLTYTPAANYFGSDSFTYRANDGSLDSDLATASITVTSVNDAPHVTPASVTTAEDTAVGITLVGSDIESNPLTYLLVTLPQYGTLSGTAPNLIYTPAANYFGSDSFTYRVNDGSLDSNLATVSITVTAVNDAPQASPVSVTTAEDTAVGIALVGSDIENDPLTYVIVDLPQHGTLSGTAPNLTYTPAANYFGSDSLRYRVNDGVLDSDLATVSVTVAAVNDAPQASSISLTRAEDTAGGIVLEGSDVENNPLIYVIVDLPQHGTLSGTAPNLTYMPAANYFGPDSFTYRVNDDSLDSDLATVSITVSPVNDAPIASNNSITTAANTSVNFTLVASDVEDEALTYILVSGPQHGGLAGIAPHLTYTPDSNYSGDDAFTFRVNDGSLNSNLATISISITGSGANHRPSVAVNGATASANEGQNAVNSGTWTDIDAGDTVTLTASIGTVTKNLDGTWSWTFGSTDSDQSQTVTVTATDSHGAQGNTTFALLINNLNPVITSLTSSAADPDNAAFNIPVTIQGLFTDPGYTDTHHAAIDWGDGSQTMLAEGDIDQVHRTFAGSHLYSAGGDYIITVTMYDDDGGSASQTTQSYVAGAGLHDGVLEIYGTAGRDIIRVHRHGSLLVVHTLLSGGSHLDDDADCDDEENGDDEDSDRYYRLHQRFEFALDAVSSILIVVAGGNDHVYVGHAITQPAMIDGGLGNDWLHGGGGNDTIIDLAGNNRIHAGKGDDVIHVGDGCNRIWTDGGDDVVATGNGNNEIHAGRGNNTITTGSGDDRIWTDGGDDYINAGDGDNEIHSGDGNDTVVTGRGNDQIWSGGGDDVIQAGDGNNCIDAGAGNDVVTTGSGRDQIDAGAGNDLVRAGAGNDTIQGGSGDDILLGGDGDDTINGGNGRDLLIGGKGADRIIGNAEEDILIAGTKAYDNIDAALAFLLSEWTSAGSYQSRVANIKAGTGLTHGYRLVGDDGALQTVFNDDDVDILTGSQGQDWFFANQVADNGGALDVVTDKAANELWNDTDF